MFPETIFIVVGLCEDGMPEEEATRILPTKELAEEAREDMLGDDFEDVQVQEYEKVEA